MSKIQKVLASLSTILFSAQISAFSIDHLSASGAGAIADTKSTTQIEQKFDLDSLTEKAKTTAYWVKKLSHQGIADPGDQKIWADYINNCILPNISIEKLAKIARKSPAALNKFLQSYHPPDNLHMPLYNHMQSCPDARPVAQTIIAQAAGKHPVKSAS